MLASAIARSEAARSAEVLRVGVESAGHYHRTLVARLRSGGYEVVELNPAAVKESRAQQILARLKSDARDLGAMAELMVRGAGRQPALRTDALATQAAWVAHRRRKVTARVALANQVIGELDLVFPGQLKHAATRITQAYIGKASSWVDPVLEEQRRAADRLY